MTSDPLRDEADQLVLSDLINRVLDKGVVIAGDVVLSVADIDLVKLNLTLVLTAVESEMRRLGRPPAAEARDADAPVLPAERER